MDLSKFKEVSDSCESDVLFLNTISSSEGHSLDVLWLMLARLHPLFCVLAKVEFAENSVGAWFHLHLKCIAAIVVFISNETSSFLGAELGAGLSSVGNDVLVKLESLHLFKVFT